jgi:hypothetical protein
MRSATRIAGSRERAEYLETRRDPESADWRTNAIVPLLSGPLLQRSSLNHRVNSSLLTTALLHGQRTHGNRAAQRTLAAMQAKLAINQPGDRFEQEADQMADAAVSGMACSCGGTCGECRSEEVARRTTMSPAGGAGTAESPGMLGSGRPLDSGIRESMETHFGRSFEDVRVHTDEDAAEAAQAVDARAYTVGSHIVFGQSQFDPATTEGQRLLAHELAHVIQQLGAPNRIQRQPVETEDEVHVPKEVCGTGEIRGQVYICCHPNPHPHVRECFDLHDRVFKECYDKTEKDDRARELCEGKAAFEDCHCLARHLGKEYCRCSGLV